MSIRYKVVQNHLKEHLLNSMTVQLDEIGTFRVGFKSAPCDKEEDFKANNIKRYRILYRPVTTFTPSGHVTGKGRRLGTYTKTLLEGVHRRAAVQDQEEGRRARHANARAMTIAGLPLHYTHRAAAMPPHTKSKPKAKLPTR